ncbi:MAG: hypothetical protein WCP15_01320 [bacterium]
MINSKKINILNEDGKKKSLIATLVIIVVAVIALVILVMVYVNKEEKVTPKIQWTAEQRQLKENLLKANSVETPIKLTPSQIELKKKLLEATK